MEFKVLSYNLYFHKGSRDILYLIEKYDPDILCFQETKDDPVFIETLKQKGFHLANLSPSFKKYGQIFSIATFYRKTKIDISFTNYLDLPKSLYEKALSFFYKKHFPRSFIKTIFNIANKDILLLNSHLSPWATDIERVRQLKKLLKEVKKENTPAIILGDFNYPYGRKRLENIIKEADLTEATDNILYTLETKVFKIIPVRMKLDYILYKNLVHKKTLLLEKMSSDHFPILASFEVQK